VGERQLRVARVSGMVSYSYERDSDLSGKSDRLFVCVLAALPAANGLMARLVARHHNLCPAGAPWRWFLGPWVEWPPASVMGWPRASMLRTRRWAGTALDLRECGKVLDRQLGYGVAGPAGGLSYALPMQLGWLLVGRLFSAFAPRDHAVVLRGPLASCEARQDKTMPADRPA